MTNPEPQSRGNEYPPLEDSAHADPYAPVDYPTSYPGYGEPPPSQPYPPPYAPSAAYPPPPGAYPPPPGAYPQPYGFTPYDPYGQTKPQGTNGKAIAALITALGGLVLFWVPFVGFAPAIAAIILGILGIRETKRTGQDGYGLALAGLIIGGLIMVLVIVVVIIFIVIASSPSSYSTY